MLGQPVKAAFDPLSEPIEFPFDALGKRIELALETLGERVKLALKPAAEGIYLTRKTAEPVLDRPEASVATLLGVWYHAGSLEQIDIPFQLCSDGSADAVARVTMRNGDL